MTSAQRGVVDERSEPRLDRTEDEPLGRRLADRRDGKAAACAPARAPSTLAPGSSVSHFSTAATPNLLMEPNLHTSIFDKVDQTLPLFQDIGWRTRHRNPSCSSTTSTMPVRAAVTRAVIPRHGPPASIRDAGAHPTRRWRAAPALRRRPARAASPPARRPPAPRAQPRRPHASVRTGARSST